METWSLHQTSGDARLGCLHLPHGDIETPTFMPVGTQASVKTLAPWEVEDMGYGLILANTYHLLCRPGSKLIAEQGGLHHWMKWKGNILTDSGGFQVWSLAQRRKITSEGVTFRSHIDGSPLTLTPESVVQAQSDFGSDIMMVLDECTTYPATDADIEKSLALTINWEERALQYWTSVKAGSPRKLFGILQGGMNPKFREAHARILGDMDFDGLAIGGLSVGEPKPLMKEMTACSAQALPANKVRYLMGVGKPEDLVEAVRWGVDIFDCVLPTRNARNGGVFLRRGQGKANIKNARFKSESGPLDASCQCRGCSRFSASYIHHLFKAGEVLALRLLTEHNLYSLHLLMKDVRQAIKDDRYESFYLDFFAAQQEAQRESPQPS